MEIIHVNDNLILDDKIIATIGEFDGLHKGHMKLINECNSLAKTNNCKSGLICFYPHPDYVLNKRKYEAYLTELNEKIEILENNNIDYLFIVKCDMNLLKLDKFTFYDKYLKDFYGLVVGFDFHFGYLGKGDSLYLKELFKNKIFSIVSEESYVNENKEIKKISSNDIRMFLEEGKLSIANELLGYNYNFKGIVEKGKGLGRKLAYPTANINIDKEKFIPRNGVYACIINICGKLYKGMCNIGKNPSLDDLHDARIEAHIFDFNEDIYDKLIKIEIVEFIRDEITFDNIEDLRKQISLDKEQTITFFRSFNYE